MDIVDRRGKANDSTFMRCHRQMMPRVLEELAGEVVSQGKIKDVMKDVSKRSLVARAEEGNIWQCLGG